ncbi:CpaE family protein [Isoptericola sp. NPDC057191]|uniref:AAA family ATPase n=1 Tax=Isoptericola sp. NPDC057191 TaxID=3346041 RepID=UPI00362D16EF
MSSLALPAASPRDRDVERPGRVVTVLSPKGGVGKTTVATNLAVGLALAEPHSTVLVDLDVQFGDVASALDLSPQHALPDAVRGAATGDGMVLKTFLTLHPATGLSVVCGVDDPADADGVTGADVDHLLAALAGEFRHVVVDTAPGLSEHTLAALDRTTDPVLLASMDVPGVRGLRKELDVLDALGVFPDGRFVAMNFADRASGLSLADVTATLGTSVDLVLPRSRAVPASVNLGVPVLQSGVRDPITKPLRSLAARFTDEGSRVTGRPRGRHFGGRR